MRAEQGEEIESSQNDTSDDEDFDEYDDRSEEHEDWEDEDDYEEEMEKRMDLWAKQAEEDIANGKGKEEANETMEKIDEQQALECREKVLRNLEE